MARVGWVGKGQRSLPGFSFEYNNLLCQFRSRRHWEARTIVMDEVSTSNFPVNKEVIEYMLILQEKFPQSM